MDHEKAMCFASMNAELLGYNLPLQRGKNSIVIAVFRSEAPGVLLDDVLHADLESMLLNK